VTAALFTTFPLIPLNRLRRVMATPALRAIKALPPRKICKVQRLPPRVAISKGAPRAPPRRPRAIAPPAPSAYAHSKKAAHKGFVKAVAPRRGMASAAVCCMGIQAYSSIQQKMRVRMCVQKYSNTAVFPYSIQQKSCCMLMYGGHTSADVW